MTLSRRLSQYLPATVLLLGLLSLLPGGYIQFLTGWLFLFIIQGFVAWLLFYKAGQSFYGYSAFMIVGAYTCVVLQRVSGVPLLLQIVLGAILSSLLAIVFFLCTSRARGFYAGMASFLLAILMPKVVEGLYSVTGGRSGIQFNGLNDLWGANIYLVALILVTVAIVAFVIWLCNIRVGKVLTLVAENEPLALSAGINSFSYKLLAYGIAGLLSGLGGGLYINYIGSISSIDITVFTSVSIFFIPLLGSKRSPYGPIVGAMFVVLIPELFASVERYLDLLFGLAYILVMIFLPDGIILGVGNLAAKLRRIIAGPKVAGASVKR